MPIAKQIKNPSATALRLLKTSTRKLNLFWYGARLAMG